MYWHSLYQNRFSWAERAYEKFLTELDPELAKAFKREKEISIVLYGPTQVGKTTLLLKLMGLAEKEFDRVATVLRGNQKKGCSATAVPTYYEISPDGNWYIDEVGSSALCDDDVVEMLADIRADVESGSAHYNKIEPCKVYIPRYYFSNSKPDLRTKVLDLPGIMAANDNERELVERVSEKFVPTADLVLMVAKADDMSFLYPKNIAIEEVADWVYTPKRFRIIFTHTFSSASFRQVLGREIDTADQVSSYFLEQLKTHIPDLDIKIDQVYPLEYGASYKGISESSRSYFQKVDQIMSGLFTRLKEDITSSGTKENRIRSALDVHVVAERKKNDFVRDQEFLMDKLSERRDVLIENRTLFRSELESELEIFKSLESDISEESYKLALVKSVELIKPDADLRIKGERVDDIRSFIRRSKVDFKRKLSVLINELDMLGFSVDVNASIRHFDKLERKLDDYFFSEYFPSISDDFDRDKDLAYSSERRMFDDLKNKINHDIDVRFRDAQQVFSGKLMKSEGLIKSLIRKIDALSENVDSIDSEIDELDFEIESYKERMADNSRKSLLFKEYLEEEYRFECRNIFKLVQCSEGLKKFYALCYSRLVSNIYLSLME